MKRLTCHMNTDLKKNKSFLMSGIVKKHIISMISMLMAGAFLTCTADSTTAVLPFLTLRSQSENSARELSGMTNHTNTWQSEKNYITASIAPEYTHSLNHTALTQSLFGCYYLQERDELKITGTTIDNNASNNLAAYWLYLPNNYRGSICFKPAIQNFTVDLNVYWAMDTWAEGLFVRIAAPLVATNWNLNANFTTVETDINPQNGINLLESAEDYFCEGKNASAPDALYHPLSCSRFCRYSCSSHKTKAGLADIRTDLGWHFLLKKDKSLGAFARIVIPTGNRPKGIWLFEPVVGNGHHWELGAGLMSDTLLWHNEEGTKGLSFVAELSATHLFGSSQNRVFDLKDKPLSRYMYAQREGLLEFAPLANLTSCAVDVSIGAQASLVALFNYTHHNWSYDLGYNFWTRSHETFSACSCKNRQDTCCDTCGNCIIKKGNHDNWYLPFSDATISFLGTHPNTTPLSGAEIEYAGARSKSSSQKLFSHLDYCWTHHDSTPHVGLGCEIEFGHHAKPPASSNNCSTFDQSIAVSQAGVWIKGGATF